MSAFEELPGEIRWFRVEGGYGLKQKFVRKFLLPPEAYRPVEVFWRDVPLAGQDGKTLAVPMEALIMDAEEEKEE